MRSIAFGTLLVAVAATTAADSPTDEQLEALYARPSPFDSIPRDQWVAESENAFVIRSNEPLAPVHLLVISKQRYPTMLQAPPELYQEMLLLARKVAEQEGVARSGFRIVINTHPQGSQSVYHFLIHVLGGRQMRWPPG
jgi:histidine triad (HIT) family protein